MALPTFSDLRTYVGKLLTNTDWDFNFQKIVNYMSDGLTDMQIKALTLLGALSGTTATFSSTVTATSFIGSGAALTGINSTIGQISMFGGTTDPTGWLICDGRQVARSGLYADLYAILGTKYGYGDNSTTFNIPDFRSFFPRGASWGSLTFAPADVDTTADTISIAGNNLNRNGVAVRFTTATSLPSGLSTGVTYYLRIKTSALFEVYDTMAHAIDTSGTTGRVDLTTQGTGTHTVLDYSDPDYATRTAPMTGGSTGATVGSMQIGAFISHTHTVTTATGDNNASSGGKAGQANGTGTPLAYTSAATGGNETRPLNLSCNFMIRYA